MAMSESPKKEDTILSLSEEIYKTLDDFQTRLDNRFQREAKGETVGQDSPVIPNVLDEIIARLEADLTWLRRISGFISSEVLPKIN